MVLTVLNLTTGGLMQEPGIPPFANRAIVIPPGYEACVQQIERGFSLVKTLGPGEDIFKGKSLFAMMCMELDDKGNVSRKRTLLMQPDLDLRSVTPKKPEPDPPKQENQDNIQ